MGTKKARHGALTSRTLGWGRRLGVFFKVFLSYAVIAAMTGVAPHVADAQTLWERLRGDPNDLPDRLMLRAGFAHFFDAETTLRFNDTLAGLGTTVDWDDTLGGDDHANVPRVDAMFRFNPRHSIAFSWYRVDRDGFTILILVSK